MNPLVPAAYDVVWSVVALCALALALVALVRWWRRRESAAAMLLWFAVILLLPVAGPLAYLAHTSAPGGRARDGA